MNGGIPNSSAIFFKALLHMLMTLRTVLEMESMSVARFGIVKQEGFGIAVVWIAPAAENVHHLRSDHGTDNL